MNTQELELQQYQAIDDAPQEKAVLDLFSSLKWAVVVLCVAMVASIVVQPWFLAFGVVLSIAIILSDARVASALSRKLMRLFDTQYDAIEEVFSDARMQMDSQYARVLSQALDIYREIKAAILDRNGMFAESFGDVLPAIQALMEKIALLTRKAQAIDHGLRCHDDMERTSLILQHYQQKIERDAADDFIRAEWMRTRDSLIKQLKSQEEILRGKEYVQSKLTNILTSLREVHLSIIRLSFSEIREGSDELSSVYHTVMHLSEAIDDTVETLDRITYQQV